MTKLFELNSKKSLLASAAMLSIMAMVTPQMAVAQDNESEGDEIVVTGIRATIDDALNNKRKADVILDGISADDLGNFPDLNLGEALQRITGVQINREAERRDASITVRGLPGNFTQTTVMGQNISNPNLTGGNPFGVFDSSIFSGVDIIKSFRADNISGGLAAQVNLKIKPALERKDGQLILRARGEYEELTEKLNPGIYASGSKHFADGKIGVFGTVSYSEQNFRRDAINITRYNSDSRTLNALTPDSASNRVDLYVGDIRQFVQVSEGDRISAAGGFEFQPQDNLSLRLDGIYTKRNLDKATTDILQVQPRLSREQITALGEPQFVGTYDFQGDSGLEDVYVYNNIQFEDPQVVFGNRDRPFFAETLALYPQLTWENDDWRVNLIGTFSESKNTTIQNQYDARILQTGGSGATNGATNGVVGRLNTFGTDLTDLQYTLDIPDGTLNLDVPDGTAPNEVGAYALTSSQGLSAARWEDGIRSQFTVAGFARGAIRDLKAIGGDVEHKFSRGPFVGVKFGGRYEEETAERYDFENSIIGLNINNLDNSVIVPNTGVSQGDTFFGGNAPGFLSDNFLSIDRERAFELLNTNRPALDALTPRSLSSSNGRVSNFIDFVEVPNPFTPFNQRLQNARNGSDARTNAAIANTFDSERENLEIFGMVNFDFNENYDTFPVRGNFGVRYVDADLSGLAEGEMEEGEGRYKKWLPSANFIADLTDDLVLQGAYYKTFEAFNLAEFNPSASIVSPAVPNPDATDPENRAGTINIRETNLGLDPRSSEAFDIGLAWYNRPGSIVGVNLFTKEVIDIDRISSSSSDQACLLPLDDVTNANPDAAAAIGNGTPFVDSEGNCRLDVGGITEFANPRLNVSQVINTNPIRVNGLEFQVTQNTDFLDGFWGNFGGTFNYTYTKQSGRDSALAQVSKNTYNLIGYYETDKFSIRLAQNYRSKYNLDGGGTFFGSARQVKARSQLDLAATYNPMSDLQLKLQVFNITDAIREEFQGFELLPRRVDYDGRTVTFSVQKKF